MNPEGYYTFRCPTVNVWIGMRGLDADVAKARALCAQLRIYPYKDRENPPQTKHIRPEGKKWTGEQPRGIKYWELLAKLINEEPPIERDRIMLATLVPHGIEKGKSFAPRSPRWEAAEELDQDPAKERLVHLLPTLRPNAALL